jgi:hypothetical protein
MREVGAVTTSLEQAPLETLLRRCTEDGVITSDQADRIRAYAGAEHAPATRRSQVVVEALGYLGGAIVLAGSVLVGARYWSDLGTGWRITVLGAGTALLLLAGWFAGVALPDAARQLGARLRAVLWLVSLGCLAGLLVVLGDRVLDLGDRSMPLLVGAGCAALALALWLAHRTAVQQVAMMAGFALAAAGALHRAFAADDVPGLGVWATGLAWILLGLAGALGARRLTLVLGSAMTIFGAMLTAGSDAGMVLTLVTVAAVIAGSVLERDLILLAVGALGTLANVPAAMTKWFPDSASAAFALIAAGAALVVIAVFLASGRPRPSGR